MLFVKAFDKNKKYRVGLDLGDDFCQLSYAETTGEVATLSVGEGEEEFNIPTLLFKTAGKEEWFFGRGAAERASDPGGTLIPHLLETAVAGQPVILEGASYDAERLLVLYVNRCLRALGESLPLDRVGALMITTPVMDRRTVALLERLREELPIPAEQVFFEEHDSALYHYMLGQEEELRSKDVLLLEYRGRDRLQLTRLLFNRRTTPVVCHAQNTEYASFPAGSPVDMDRLLTDILRQEMAAGTYSCAFLIGEGFAGGWMRDSLRLLCRQCRVFQGNNLYSKGAVQGAREKVAPSTAGEAHFFLGENKLRANIGVQAINRGREGYYPLLDAGTNWYEARREEDLLLEGTNELQLILMPLTGGRASEYSIRLDELPVREDRITRVRLSLSMESEQQLSLRIRDLGFGEIFPSSGLRWEKGIAL